VSGVDRVDISLRKIKRGGQRDPDLGGYDDKMKGF
jgi:hypothetical protein